MGREILPPFPFGDVMAQTRWYQEVRRQQRKQDVFNLQTIRDLGSGNRTQNLLSSSLLHPSADAQFTLSTTDAVHRFYLGPTIGDDAFGSLVDMGLSPGDVISASIEALPTKGQVARVQLIFSVSKVFSEDNSVSTTISTHLGVRVTADTGLPPASPAGSPAETAVIASEFGTTKVENIRIPDDASYVQINAISDSTSTAGDITWRRAMLNSGAAALEYTAPPLRPDRENTLIGQQSYLELDSTDSYVTVPDNSAWDFAANVTRTIEIEFLADDFFPLTEVPPATAITESLIIKKPFVGNGWRAFYREGGTISASVFNTTVNFPDGEFATPLKKTHLAITRDASGVHRLYVNGKFGVTFTDNTDVSNAAALLFGAFPDGVGGFERFMDGRLYYVRIWDVVRTQLELIDDRHTIFPDSTTNLRGDWQFNEQSGKIVRNHGDVANTDGVIVGTGFIWRGPAVNALPNMTNVPIETSIASGDFLFMEDITDNLSGKITFADFESTLNHDSLAGFVANEHIDHTSVSIATASSTSGLSGGGTIASTRNLVIDIAGTTDETTPVIGDELIINNVSGPNLRKADIASIVNLADHDALTNFVSGEHYLQSAITEVGTVTTGSVDAVVSAASLTLAGKVELATVAETNTGTDATRAVTPDGLDGFTGSAQIVTVGTLLAGDVTTQVSASSETLAGKVELATDAETVTGTDTARATTPANITAKMSAPGAIGNTTAGTGEFTTGNFSGILTVDSGNELLLTATSRFVSLIFQEDGSDRYIWRYDDLNNDFVLSSFDIDGIQTAGDIITLTDGTNDVRFAGGISTDGNAAPTSGITTNAVIVNSNHAMEGYSTGRNVFRSILLRLQPGATPGTNINATDISSVASAGFNVPTIVDGTNIAKSGTSNDFSLNAGGDVLTMDITEAIVGTAGASIKTHDLNSSSTTEVYFPDISFVSGNLALSIFKRGTITKSDLTTILDTGDLVDINISFVTST